MGNLFQRKKPKDVHLTGANLGLEVGFAPFFKVSTSTQFAIVERAPASIKTVTWNTLQYTPLLLLDPENQSVSLVNLSGITTFLVGRREFTDFINLDTYTRVGRCAIEQGLGKELLRCALADSNTKPELAHEFVSSHRERMLLAFRASNRIVIDNTTADIRIPVTPNGADWTDEEILEITRNYLLQNSVRNDRMLEWYQHLTTSATVWSFPMENAGKKLPPVWDASTCTPDIPWKKALQAEIRDNVCWQRWLEGEYLVMSLDDSAPRDPDKEPIGALKVSNHMLAIMAPGCTTALTGRGLELKCFGKVARGSNPGSGEPKILHYDYRSSERGSQAGTLITTQSPYTDYWIGAAGFV
jgi:hypothetical protein